MSNSDLPQQGGSPGSYADDAVFQTLLGGLQGAFKRALGLDSVLFTFNDSYKQRILNDANVKYPRATVKITNVELLTNLNNYTLGRRGLVAPQPPDLDTGTAYRTKLAGPDVVPVFNFFQVKGSFELHLFDTDRKRSLSMMNNLVMLTGSKRLGFSVTIDDSFEYQVLPIFDTNIPLPDQETAAVNDRGLIDMMLTFTAQGYVGRIDKVQRVLKVNYGYIDNLDIPESVAVEPVKY